MRWRDDGHAGRGGRGAGAVRPGLIDRHDLRLPAVRPVRDRRGRWNVVPASHTRSRHLGAAGQMPVLDSSLTLAAAGAAVTDRIAIGFSVYVPSLRPLAWAAKQIASLQHIAASAAPAPSAQSWELLAQTRHLLNQR